MGIDNDKDLATAATQLRRRAEERLSAKGPGAHPPPMENEAQRLLHELQVHEIELEMQNAELRLTRDELEKALDKYIDLYDFAPVGYFTFDLHSTIMDVNLSGAGLLGVERSRLIGRRFGLFVADEDLPAFTAFLGTVFAGQDKESCEVTLLNKEGETLPRIVQIDAMAGNSGWEIHVAVIDITERKRVEESLRVRNEELARFNSASVGRELRMIEFKKEINELCVQSGQPPRYPLDFEKE